MVFTSNKDSTDTRLKIHVFPAGRLRIPIPYTQMKFNFSPLDVLIFYLVFIPRNFMINKIFIFEIFCQVIVTYNNNKNY